ncbi:MAG: hypothetical protein WC788_05940 [Candidatus Paceibacterota bacterium]|jgi:hypothetical protein
MDFWMVLYLVYLFVICILNAFAGGVWISTGKTWDKIVGAAAILMGILGMGYAFSLMMGVSSIYAAYLMIAPLVGLGLIITVDSWYIYKETKSVWVLLIAIYNTIVTLWNLVMMLKLLKDVEFEDIVKIGAAGGGAVAFGLSNAEALLLSLAISAIIVVIVACAGRKLYNSGDVEARKIDDRYKQKSHA